MNWNELLEGNGIVAWGVAFLLAVGGTAVVVAAWLQFRNTWRRLPRTLAGRRAAPEAAPTRVERPAAETPNPKRALKAYRDQSARPDAPARPPAARPAATVPELSAEKLNAYLDRLRHAVDELEVAAAGSPTAS